MTIDNTKTVAFSGHRPERLPQDENALEALRKRLDAAIEQAIRDGYDTFLYGCAMGFDQMAAEQVLLQKQKPRPENLPPIRLIAAIPYEQQAASWKEPDRDKYFDTLALCDAVITLTPQYRRGCLLERNRWMVDRAGLLICAWDGGKTGGTGYTVKYAEKHGLTVVNVFA